MTFDEIFGVPLKPRLSKAQAIMTTLFLFFESIATRQYVYEGLPEEIPFWAIEKALYFRGECVAFDVGGNKFVLPCALNGGLDAYNRYIAVQPIGFNGQSFPTVNVVEGADGSPQTGVLFYNNEFKLSTYALIAPLVNRLAYIWESLGINEGLSRVKWLIRADKKTASSIKYQADAMFDSGNPIMIVGDKKFLATSKDGIMDKQDFNVPYQPSDYWEDFDNTFFLCLTLIGVENAFMDSKKERLTAMEPQLNNAITNLANDARMKYREDAIEQVNKLWGCNAKVRRATDIEKEKALSEATSLLQKQGNETPGQETKGEK